MAYVHMCRFILLGPALEAGSTSRGLQVGNASDRPQADLIYLCSYRTIFSKLPGVCMCECMTWHGMANG